ncbi:flagellar protein FliO/FliZ [Clostridium amylolyticum]|uniref:Flagellar protein n=1 Tax=Clostridium amylolyticum TaxID=1121298 RepID=A0A1M6CFZ2_9CLOT|nr:flagellar biosynthetic protein FliO [Clostridium amylolyticum]SHI59955.1 flagellar protein FliO/FliZ [Clostridium amylolyticum]
MNTVSLILKIIVFLPFVITLIYLSLKFGGNKLQNMQNGSYMKIIERVQVSKENSLMLAKIGEKAYIMSSSPKGIEILEELSKEELLHIEEKKAEASAHSAEEMKKLLNKINIKGRFTK